MKMGALPLTLRQLQYVVAVAQDRNFKRAAERCLVSQPSLSAQIAEAENALGVQLFERKHRPLIVTQAGLEIVRRARQVLVDVDDLLASAQRHSDPFGGTLRLGVIPTIAPYLLPSIDPALRREFPSLTLEWTEDKTTNLVAQTEGGALDGAVLALEADLGSLVSERLGHDDFVLATPRDHELASRKGPVRLADLRDEGVLLLDDGHCFRDQALELCAAAAVAERSFRATSLATLAQMVAGGNGVTLMPEMSLPRENDGHRLAIRKFAEPAPGRIIVLAYRAESALAASLISVAEVGRGVFRRTSSRSTNR